MSRTRARPPTFQRLLRSLTLRQRLTPHVQGVRLNYTIFAPAFKNSREKRCFFSI